MSMRSPLTRTRSRRVLGWLCSVSGPFTPEAWLDGRETADWWIFPFSAGPAAAQGVGPLLPAAERPARGVPHIL